MNLQQDAEYKKTKRGKGFRATALTLAIAAATLSPWAQAKDFTIDIPSQPLAEALLQFSEQTDIVVIAPAALVDRRIAPSVRGALSAEATLDKLLQGSGLVYRFKDDKTLVIESSGQNRNSDASLDNKAVALMLEEIMVTAEKRAESAHDLPLAISAFSGENIANAGVTGIRDLKQLAPSLQFGERFGNNLVTIRGIGSELQDIGAEPGVIVSQDGVPFVQQSLFDSNFLDIERVEVLRGPQGTISGRNATGGAINVHSKRPTEEFEAGAKATLGNYHHRSTEAYLSGPLSGEKLLGRLVVRAERADGWMKNTFLDEDRMNVDKVQGRALLLANLGDGLEADLILEGSVDRSDITGSVDLGRARADKPGRNEFLGLPGFDRERLEYQADFPDRRRLENYKGIFKLSWDLGPSTTLTSTTGHIDHEMEGKNEADASIAFLSHFPQLVLDMRQLSQELTLTTDLSDRLDMIAGGLILQADAKEIVDVLLPTITLNLEADQELISYALYTQWRYRFKEDWRLSLGARYTYDTKEYTDTTKDGEQSWGAFTPRLALDYTPTDDLTLFASISRGFKAGGFNTFGSIAGAPNKFEPEFVWNYEAGVKAKWLDQRLRTALTAFYMDYKNLQQGLFRLDARTGLTVSSVENATAATIGGIELELEAHLTEGLKLTASATWLDATYDELTSFDTIFPELKERDLEGNRLSRTPEFQFNISGEYTVPLAGDWLGILRADYQWQDHIYFTFFNHDLNAQDAYGLLNVSALVERMDGRWQLSVFARNVLDKRYVSNAISNPNADAPPRTGLIGAPRMYGVNLAYRF